jgi:hypothetical protein
VVVRKEQAPRTESQEPEIASTKSQTNSKHEIRMIKATPVWVIGVSRLELVCDLVLAWFLVLQPKRVF